MSYGVGVEYALHCLVYLIDVPEKTSVGIKELSEFQGLSETFLSKVFGKLSKAGIVCSVPGVKGGYKLARSAEEISFWNVVEAVEGVNQFFNVKTFYRVVCHTRIKRNPSVLLALREIFLVPLI